MRRLLAAAARGRGQDGQTMAEYAVVLGVISGVIVASIALLSQGIQDKLANVIDLI